MIYTTNGITNSKMKEIETDGIQADFEYIKGFTQDFQAAWREKTETLSKTPISKAKKNGTYFIPGVIEETEQGFKRNNKSVLFRSLVVIDIDETDLSFEKLFEEIKGKIGEYKFLLYPTVSHSKEKTKARLIVEPSNVMDKSEYEATVQEVSKLIDVEVDSASKVWSQHMGLPVSFKGYEDEFQKLVNAGEPYEVVKVDTLENQIQKQEKFQLPEELPDGKRTNNMFKYIASLQAKNLSDEAIRSAAEAENQKRCDPPLTQEVLNKMINNVITKYPKGPSKDYVLESEFWKDTEDEGKPKKYFLVLKNIQNPEKGLKVNVSLLAMYMKEAYDIKIYKGQFRVKINSYYQQIENMRYLISSEIPEEYRIPANIRDCEDLLLMDRELILKDEDLADERYISFANGVLNVNTMNFREHGDKDAENLVFINQVGCSWNPDAEIDPTTELFFNSCTDGAEEDVQYLYEILGVLISGYRNFKNIFYFTGQKDTGKSRFLALAERLLTNPDGTKDFSNIGLRILTDETSKEFTRIIGKRANISAETPNMKITNDTLLKQLSGGDTISAQVKFKDSIEFRNKALLIFSGNTVPQFFISDKSSLGERLLIYEFKNKIQKKDQIKEIEKKMNLEYVVYKAIQGLKNFINNNQEFTPPTEVEGHREEMLMDSDTIYKFYKLCLVDTKDPKHRISNVDLYNRYIDFMVREGHLSLNWDGRPDLSRFKISQYVFTGEIKKYHGKERFKRNLSYKNNKADVFIGLELKSKVSFHPVSEAEDKVIKAAFGNSTF